MLRLLIAAAVVAVPAHAYAQSVADTHEQVSTPGKQWIGHRPLVRTGGTPTCHPDWSKAPACRDLQAARRAAAVETARPGRATAAQATGR